MTPYAKLIRCQSRPLAPLPTAVEPQLTALASIQAVLFDVYGTLVASASGDIGTTAADRRVEAAAGALEALGVSLQCEPAAVAERLVETIARHHEAARQRGISHPEVDIVDVWQETYRSMAAAGAIAPPPSAVDFRQLAVAYEVRVNPVWPMPHFTECIDALRATGRRLGIVSNAQFFTPELFPALVGRSLDELGFDPGCRYYSYEHGQAKPGEYLYRLAAETLAAEGVGPAHVLYIGNDVRNDIRPAAAVGFRTALFAGDARSLRLRRDDPELADIVPDAVVTDLAQVPELLGA